MALLVVGAAAWYWHVRNAAPATGPLGGSPASGDATARSGAPPAAGPGASRGAGRRGADPRTVLPVAVAAARKADFTVWLDALGNITARSTVVVRPRVDGQLARVLFREGQTVKAGDVLAEIDPAPFEVQVLQASGQLARDQAQLANARIDLARYETLLKQDSIAQQQVDTQAALVRQLEGTIAADRAAVENAKLQLSYTKIKAPAAGRAGLLQVDAGNMVRQSDASGIVVITQVQPINVLFAIPEDRLGTVLREQKQGAPLEVQALDRDGREKLASGKLVSIDNQIDPTTGTIKLKAEFANENGTLFPNQFVNVRLKLDTLVGATTVPTSAIQRGSPGTFVYRVNADNTVSVRPVRLGPAEGEVSVIADGLVPGDRVVTDGADKLRDGATIEPVTAQERAAAVAPPARPARAGRAAHGAAPGARTGAGAASTAPAGAR